MVCGASASLLTRFLAVRSVVENRSAPCPSGTRDGLATPADVERNRAKLPAATRWVWIEGGNHSQFGWYGFQPGDRRATVSAGQQREVMVRAVLDALRTAAIETKPE